jgi:hypothetical protein
MKLPFSPLRDIFLFIVAVSAVLILLRKRKTTGTKLREKEYAFFDSMNIKGRLTDIGFRLNASSFEVDNNQHEFIFDPEISDQGSFFNANTEKGDSVIKPAFSQYIVVKGKGVVYKYRFKKPK